MNDRHKLILGLLILVGTSVYGFFQWQERESLLADAKELSGQATELTSVSKTLEEEYQSIKVEVSADRAIATQELATVFPTTEKMTDLTRAFDDFAVKNNFESNPFFISSMSYDDEKVDASGTYRYVPVSLNLTTSKKNLVKFLAYIETSGSLEGKTRLMSIEDLTVNYPAEYGGIYEVQVELNAYYSQSI